MGTLVAYRVFVSIVEQNSLSSAAADLHMSPSSISKQLSKLEDYLGVQLIDRSTHALSVTAAGHRFYHECKDILLRVNEAERQIKEEQEAFQGRIVISFSRVLCKSIVMDLLTDFNLRYPNIVFELLAQDEQESLVSKKIDFTFRLGESKDLHLIYIPLQETKMVICVSPDYIKKHGDPQKGENAHQQKIIIPSYISEKSIKGVLAMTNDPYIQNLDNHHFTNDVVMLIESGIAGMGMIASFDISVSKALDRGDLVQIFSDVNIPASPLSLVYHKRSHMPQYLSVFKDFVRDYFSIEAETETA